MQQLQEGFHLLNHLFRNSANQRRVRLAARVIIRTDGLGWRLVGQQSLGHT